jgi:hypothetical protein
MGWTHFEPWVYLHVSDESAAEVLVVGMASDVMQASTVL